MASFICNITIDRDVYQKLLAAAQEAGREEKDFLNDLLAAYAADPRPPAARPALHVPGTTVTFPHLMPEDLWLRIDAVCETQNVLESHVITHVILQKVTAAAPAKNADFAGVIQRQDKLRRHAAETRRRFKP